MADVNRILEYLRECGTFYLATVDGAVPHVRPRQSCCVYDGSLYFPACKDDSLYHELRVNGHVEISATHTDKSHITLSGVLVEDYGEGSREAMKKACIVDIEDPSIFGREAGIFRLERGKVSFTSLTGRVEEENI